MQNKEEPKPPHNRNSIADESTRIQISQTLGNFSALKDEGLANLEYHGILLFGYCYLFRVDI